MKTDLLKTEEAISLVKETFSIELCKRLNLVKISSPIAIMDGTGINDDLNGIEKPVSFNVKALNDGKAVVVQSLAKWKRLRLAQLGIEPGKGILTDMRALRPDEDISTVHSVYVDQWDWEKVINVEDRNILFLQKTVRSIYEALKKTEKIVDSVYPGNGTYLPEEITFIHSEDLQKEYPEMTPREREAAAASKYGAIFITGIGGILGDGKSHDGRAPDYDDWSSSTINGYRGLNGDIIVWNPVLEEPFEISSMGIRVDSDALSRQLDICQCSERSRLMFHKMLFEGKLPLSIGGGIGQSRVSMFMLRKSHIAEVQVGLWPEGYLDEMLQKKIAVL